MRICGSHTFLLLAYAVLGLSGYSFVILSLCRFLAIGKRSDDIRSQMFKKRINSFPKEGLKSANRL
jgi:hypothetical protein